MKQNRPTNEVYWRSRAEAAELQLADARAEIERLADQYKAVVEAARQVVSEEWGTRPKEMAGDTPRERNLRDALTALEEPVKR